MIEKRVTTSNQLHESSWKRSIVRRTKRSDIDGPIATSTATNGVKLHWYSYNSTTSSSNTTTTSLCSKRVVVRSILISITGFLVGTGLVWNAIVQVTTTKSIKRINRNAIEIKYQQQQQQQSLMNYDAAANGHFDDEDETWNDHDTYSWIDDKSSFLEEERQQQARPVIGYYGYGSIVGEKVVSLTDINTENANGRYWHDLVQRSTSPTSNGKSNKEDDNNKNDPNDKDEQSFDVTSTLLSYLQYFYNTKSKTDDDDKIESNYNYIDDDDAAFFNSGNNETVLSSIIETDMIDDDHLIVNEEKRVQHQLYLSHVKETAERYGFWKVSSQLEECMKNDDAYVSSSATPTTSWIENCSYETIYEFIKEAKLLIQRVKEGIYDEYDEDNDDDRTDPKYNLYSSSRRKEIIDSFGIQIIDYDNNIKNKNKANNNNHNQWFIDTKSGLAMDYNHNSNNKKHRRPLVGGTYINQAGYNGLVRKLFHAILTRQYDFHVVAVGSSNIYRANNWYQNQMMQFQYLMEPIFSKFGIRLFSRNMGMDVSSTTINALGGADIYGESDILWHIPDPNLEHRQQRKQNDHDPSTSSSSTTTKTTQALDDNNDDGPFDLLHIQSILSGERVPIILTPNPGTLIYQSNMSHVLWMGNIQPGTSACSSPSSSSSSSSSRWTIQSMNGRRQQATTQTDVCQHIPCNGYDATFIDASRTNFFSSRLRDDDDNDNEENDECRIEEQYNSICWLERPDWNPPPPRKTTSMTTSKQPQQETTTGTTNDSTIGYQDEGYPNPNQHLLESRKLAMLVLHALDEVFTQWEDEIVLQQQQTKRHPDDAMLFATLPSNKDLWYVDDVYKNIKEHVRTIPSTACDRYLQEIASEICHLQMHAYTEWTPRITPTTKRIKTIIQTNNKQNDVADYSMLLEELYHGVDLISPSYWTYRRLSKNNHKKIVDVHMIATLTQTSLSMLLSMYKKSNDVNQDDNQNNDNDDKIFDADVGDEWQQQHRQRRLFLFPQQQRSLTERQYQNNLLRRQKRRNYYDISSSITTIKDMDWKGWLIVDQPIGYCDGSSQSRCNRAIGNDCLLSNHNHYQSGVMGVGNSGPLNLQIPNIQEGIVLARFEWKTTNSMNALPDDFVFIYSINGIDEMILNKNEFIDLACILEDDVIVHPLLMIEKNKVSTTKAQTNDGYRQKQQQQQQHSRTIRLKIEIRTGFGSDASITLTHLFYA